MMYWYINQECNKTNWGLLDSVLLYITKVAMALYNIYNKGLLVVLDVIYIMYSNVYQP